MGYNYGAGCYKRVKSSIRFITVVGIVFSLILWAVVFLEPRFFLHLFTSEQELIEKGIPALQIYFCGIFMMALQFVGQSTNVALNRPKQAVFFLSVPEGDHRSAADDPAADDRRSWNRRRVLGRTGVECDRRHGLFCDNACHCVADAEGEGSGQFGCTIRKDTLMY